MTGEVPAGFRQRTRPLGSLYIHAKSQSISYQEEYIFIYITRDFLKGNSRRLRVSGCGVFLESNYSSATGAAGIGHRWMRRALLPWQIGPAVDAAEENEK